jgi:hypothetical protein
VEQLEPLEYLAGTHDLKQLPLWGPYTKKYIGISHIADAQKGLRFDLSVFPGFYRRKVDVPNTMWESGYHPWGASPDLSWFTHRHELEWKDQVYTDISYVELSEHARLVRCEFVNRTDAEQNVVLHYMASLHFPQVRGHGDRLRTCRVELPERALWTDALDYQVLSFAAPSPRDTLVYDGFYRGEERGQDLVEGSALRFGREAGDRVAYSCELPDPMEHAVLVLRCRLLEGQKLLLRISGEADASLSLLELSGTGEPREVSMSLGPLPAGRHEIVFTSMERDVECAKISAELDGFVITERHLLDQVRFVPEEANAHPLMIQGPVPNSLLLKYDGIDGYYGLLWTYDDYEVREFHCDELDRFMRHNVHHHVNSVFKGEGDSHFTNVYLRPIHLPAQSSTITHGMVCSGSKESVERQLASFHTDVEQCETVFAAVKRAAKMKPFNPSGEPYRFSQQLMEATLAMNVVYPVYTKRAYIRHNTPGRWWDSLYTWDSGFIGIGLAELDIKRSVECLNAYVTEPGDSHAAFIHHGSMVPVQHYLFLEIWNKTGSRELMNYFYPRLRQYYLFYAGKQGSSTTRTLSSNLLKTWDYFYNSGGWDDYPPQVEVHRSGMTYETAPVSTTCHAIRIAKIMKMVAAAIGGLELDIAGYEEDINVFSSAVQDNAWDEQSGYFGYVIHDAQGRPNGLLRHESGQNYNMGLDGAYPLVAGICTPDQERRLLSYITDPTRLSTAIGLSTVDQKAAYYKKDGYWNGAVWMAHQWFYWKMLLSLGYGDQAHVIARTALELWKKETEQTYNCYEHFIVESGRGAGWHHFGGLSAPVLSWFAAYHKPGTVTCGYDVWQVRTEFSGDNTELSFELLYYGEQDHSHTLLVCMKVGHTYQITWNGRPLEAGTMDDGLLDIRLPGESRGILTVSPA